MWGVFVGDVVVCYVDLGIVGKYCDIVVEFVGCVGVSCGWFIGNVGDLVDEILFCLVIVFG